MVITSCNSSPQETEAEGFLQVRDQPFLHGQPVRTYLKKKKKSEWPASIWLLSYASINFFLET